VSFAATPPRVTARQRARTAKPTRNVAGPSNSGDDVKMESDADEPGASEPSTGMSTDVSVLLSVKIKLLTHGISLKDVTDASRRASRAFGERTWVTDRQHAKDATGANKSAVGWPRGLQGHGRYLVGIHGHQPGPKHRLPSERRENRWRGPLQRKSPKLRKVRGI
jgi:hypothetical protein